MYQPYPTEAKLPEPARPPTPPSVLTAVKVMYVGAAAGLLGIIIDILTVSATKTAIEKRSPNLSVSQRNTIVGLTAPVAAASRSGRRSSGWSR